jgi:hypothetical protein
MTVVIGLAILAVLAPAQDPAIGDKPGADDVAAAPDEPEIERVGYFKSEGRDRVMVFRSARKLTEDEVRALFDRQMQTAGRLFRGVVYSGNAAAAAGGLTQASSLAQALPLTTNPPFDAWDWMYHVNPAGLVTVTPND